MAKDKTVRMEKIMSSRNTKTVESSINEDAHLVSIIIIIIIITILFVPKVQQ